MVSIQNLGENMVMLLSPAIVHLVVLWTSPYHAKKPQLCVGSCRGRRPRCVFIWLARTCFLDCLVLINNIDGQNLTFRSKKATDSWALSFVSHTQYTIPFCIPNQNVFKTSPCIYLITQIWLLQSYNRSPNYQDLGHPQ